MLVGGAATLWASPPADAHALLVSSEPVDGASLRTAPESVTLTFTEEPDTGLSSVKVLDVSGRAHEEGSLSVVDGNARTLRTQVARLGRGVFTVSWRVVSRVDGHFTTGAFAFGVRVDPTEIEKAKTAEPAGPPFAPLESAGRFLLYAGLALAVGAAWVGRFLFDRTPSRTRRLLMGGSLVAIGGFAVLAIAQQRAAEAPWSAFLGAGVGRALIERGACLLFLVVGAVWAMRVGDRISRPAALVVLGAGIATVAVHASAGHADTGRFAGVKVATQLVHFSAVAVWIGGLAALLAGIGGASDDQKARAVRRFSTAAGIALAVVAGTGIARAVAEVGSWRALFGTGYGRIVIAKVALGGVLALLGARNRWWNVPRAAESVHGLRRTSRAELGVAGVVLGLAAVLSSLAPARSISAAQPSSIVLEGSDFGRSVRVRLQITPGLPGANVLSAAVEVLRGPRAINGLTLRLSSRQAGIEATSISLRKGSGVWTARSAAIALPGSWQVAVLVDRGADSVEIPLSFHTRCRATSPTTESTPHIFDIDLPSGGSVQAYADPARPGRNEVHFTFFDAEGKELPMADNPQIDAFLRRSRGLDVRRFSAGHFVGGAGLAAGTWIFDFMGETKSGDAVTVCFSDEIR